MRNTLLLIGLAALTLTSTAAADICTYGSKNFKVKLTWTGGGTEEKSACMFSCTTQYVSITHNDCYKSATNGSSYRYTCDFRVSGQDRRPSDGKWWSFSQDFKKVDLPWNKLPNAIDAEAKLGCRD